MGCHIMTISSNRLTVNWLSPLTCFIRWLFQDQEHARCMTFFVQSALLNDGMPLYRDRQLPDSQRGDS